MIRFNQKEQIIALTPQWKGERLPDGRPKVADKYLEKMRKMTLEELWKPIFLKGYESQFEGDLKTLHNDGRIFNRQGGNLHVRALAPRSARNDVRRGRRGRQKRQLQSMGDR